jgi:hypothetical protein
MGSSVRIPFISAAALTLVTLPHVAHADDGAGPFAEGSLRVSIVLGSVSVGDDRGILGGAGVGYYVVDGLEVGLGVDHTFGVDPGITQVTPESRYVLWFVPVLKPYVGAFFRHAFIGDGYNDVESIGARAGAFWVSGGGSYFGGGVVYETVVSECGGDACTQVYPELALSLSF